MENRASLRVTALLAALLLPAAACGTGADTDEMEVPGDTGALGTPAQETPGQPGGAMEDTEFASFISTANTLEIQAAELAQQQATNPEVQQFAQQMITDHQQANQQVNQAIQGATEGMGEGAQSLREDAARMMQELQGLSGAEFDRTYIQQQVEMHQRVIDQLDRATSGPAQQLAQQLRPTLQQHLERAQQIQQQLGGG